MDLLLPSIFQWNAIDRLARNKQMLFWSLICKMNTNVLREPRCTLLPRSREKSNNSFPRDTRYSATHTSFSLLRPQSFHPALLSLCFGNFLLHLISLFRMCTLGSDSQLGLCHCWGVCVGGGSIGYGGLVRPVGSSYSRQPPSRPDPRTMGIKLLLFFPPNRRDDKDGIPLGLLAPGCTAEVTFGGG